MLAACGSSETEVHSAPAPDPLVVTRTEIRTVCPAELKLPLGARPQVPTDAKVTGNDAGMAWLNAILGRVTLLEDRLADAAKECP